jgi:hypothetical protein
MAELDDARSRLSNLHVNLKEARSLSSSSVRLQWEVQSSQPLHASQIEGYYVRYRQVEQSPINDVVRTTPSPLLDPFAVLSESTSGHTQHYHMLTVLSSQAPTNSYVLQQLQEYTQYEFFVVPFFRSVDGPPSNCRHARTLADFPSAAPHNVHVRLLNLTSVHISWQPLPVRNRNGLIQAYQLQLLQLTATNQPPNPMVNGANTYHPLAHPSASPHLNGWPPIMPSSSHLSSGPSSLPVSMALQSSDRSASSMFDAQMLRLQQPPSMAHNMFEHLSPLLESGNSLSAHHPSIDGSWALQFPPAWNSRNITTNGSVTSTLIGDLQTGATYQVRISAGNTIGFGPQSTPIVFRMDAQQLQQSDQQSGHIESNDKSNDESIIGKLRFHSQLPLLGQPSWLLLLLLFAFCATCGFSSTLAMHVLRKHRAAGVKSKKLTAFGGKLSGDLFTSGGGMPPVAALGAPEHGLHEPLWIERGWSGPIRASGDPNALSDCQKGTLRCSSSLYSARHPTCDYSALDSQNDYAEVDELVGLGSRCATARFESNACDSLQTNSSALLLSGPYASATLVDLNAPTGRVSVRDKNSVSLQIAFDCVRATFFSQSLSVRPRPFEQTLSSRETRAEYGYIGQHKPDLICQPMLYDPMIEPNSSTLLLQPSPSESGSQTTDEYSYRRYKWNANLPDQRNARKSQKTMPNASATLCSKSSTASSQLSNNSRASGRTLDVGAQSNAAHLNYLNAQNVALTNTALFQLGEHNKPNSSNPPFESFERDSPPPPAPGMFTPAAQYPNYSLYGQLTNKPTSGSNRNNLLAQRGHQTLNNRHQSKALHTSKAFEMRDGPSVNLISNPLHCHRVAASGLQGSLPSLADCGLNSSLNSSHPAGPSSRNGCVLLGELQSSIGNASRSVISSNGGNVTNNSMNSNNAHTNNGQLQSDNLYCEIEDAQRVQADFRRQLQQLGCTPESLQSEHSSIYYAGSEVGRQQAEQQRLAEQNDRLLSRPVRDFDEDDEEDEDVIDTEAKSARKTIESAPKERMPTFFGSVHVARSSKMAAERRPVVTHSPDDTEEFDRVASNVCYNYEASSNADRGVGASSSHNRLPLDQNERAESTSNNSLSPHQARPNEPMASFYRFND